MMHDRETSEAFDIVTIGSATEDVMIQCDSAQVITLESANGATSYMALEYGGKIHVDGMLITVGGGAINTAITCAMQGMKTAVLSKIGNDEPGERVKRRLQEVGAYTGLMPHSERSGTGYSTIITTFTGERTVLVHRGASRELCEADMPWKALERAQWIYVGALAGDSWRLYPLIARFAEEHGIKLALNLGTSQVARGLDEYGDLLECVHIVFQNIEEMRLLTRVEARRGDRDEREICRLLHERGVDIVVITDGARGAMASDGRAFYTVPAFPVEAASTIGAGDAFAAGCIAALWHGRSIGEALRLGAANSASVVSRPGANAGILTWDEALQFAASRSLRG